MKNRFLKTPPANPSRRRFVEGFVAGAALAGTGLWQNPAWALTSTGQSAVLSGTDFALDLVESPVNFTGTTRMATTVNGQVPAPLLRWREGDRVTLRVTNRMRVSGSIHWHGILLPSPMDGVPGLSYNGIAPGETFVYQFDVRQVGTYWYHSHTRFQEQTGLYGPIVIEPREPEPFAYNRDYVVMLSDWTDEDPEAVFKHLKQMSDYYNYVQPTAGDFIRQAEKEGLAKALDRSGYALATLATRTGMRDTVPKPDPVPMLTMADMGMSMSGMQGMSDKGTMQGMAGMDGMKESDMKGMDMPGETKPQARMAPAANVSGEDVAVKHHDAAEYGPANSMRAQQVSTRLDDPGVGLRNNGRRVLTYADLHTVGGALDPRDPTREIELHLTGNMGRYMWSFNGRMFSDSEPMLFHYGERLRIVLINDTMMHHPIHMHGMWSEVESPDAAFQVRKHTVSVAPGHRITYRVSVDARGNWAYHCHLLYHMEGGMFCAIVVV